MFSDPVSVLQEYLVHNNLDPPSYTSLISDKIYSITLVAIAFVFYDFTTKLENCLNSEYLIFFKEVTQTGLQNE